MRYTPILIVLILASTTFAQPRKQRRDPFTAQGIQVGQSLPANNIKVIRLDGKVGNLAKAWADRPALLVTSSLTCPVARRQFEALQTIADTYNGRLWVVIVYTVEAHPKGSGTPYSGRERVPRSNDREGVSRPQPKTIGERIALAREFRDYKNVKFTMAIDTMDNAVWKKLGSGPNLAVLVSAGGKVIAKHGWFDAPTMTTSIKALLAPRK